MARLLPKWGQLATYFGIYTENDNGSEIRLGYIRAQTIAYFMFALLFTRAIYVNGNSTEPFMSFDEKTGLIPLPIFHFPGWFLYALSLICIIVSLFFVITLFYQRWMPVALKSSIWLTIPFYPVVIANFIVAWMAGLQFLDPSTCLFHIVFYLGFAFFMALTIHYLLTINRKGRTTVPLPRLKIWLNKVKGLFQHSCFSPRSCLDCAYLDFISNQYQNQHEHLRILRQKWRNYEMLPATAGARCFRQLWDNAFEITDSSKIKNVLVPRICSRFFPNIGGTPTECQENHRSRTNRRWIIAGSFIGPYVATSAGYIAATIGDKGSVPSDLLCLVVIGLIGIILAVCIVNVTMNRI